MADMTHFIMIQVECTTTIFLVINKSNIKCIVFPLSPDLLRFGAHHGAQAFSLVLYWGTMECWELHKRWPVQHKHFRGQSVSTEGKVFAYDQPRFDSWHHRGTNPLCPARSDLWAESGVSTEHCPAWPKTKPQTSILIPVLSHQHPTQLPSPVKYLQLIQTVIPGANSVEKNTGQLNIQTETVAEAPAAIAVRSHRDKQVTLFLLVCSNETVKHFIFNRGQIGPRKEDNN